MIGRLLAASLLVTACAGTATSTTTEETVPTTSAVAPRPTTTTTMPTQTVEVQNCSTPPVTFSPFCEIYDLLETWYVDAPLDHEALAQAAAAGVALADTDETEEPPRTLFCAVPRQEFTVLCDAIAREVVASQVPVSVAVEAAMTHMIDIGLDPFTYYLPAELAGAVRLNGVVGGIGVLLDARDAADSKCTAISDACQLEVVAVFEENPAYEAGLTVGDIITAVDGESVVGRGFTGVVSQIAGDETGIVTLTVNRGGSAVDIAIERAELEIPTVEYGVPVPGVGYIRIPDFEWDVPPLVTDSLEEIELESPSTLVVDLRDNPGGYIDSYLEVADEFIDGGVVMISEAPDEYLEYTAEEGGAATSPRLIVLVNGATASAAEVLTGALRDRRDAIVVGTDTFGKDAVQIPFTLRNGGEFYVAVARWTTPDGDTAGDGGLTPDQTVEWPVGASVEEIIDIALEAAS